MSARRQGNPSGDALAISIPDRPPQGVLARGLLSRVTPLGLRRAVPLPLRAVALVLP
jgi:hypothetical protein